MTYTNVFRGLGANDWSGAIIMMFIAINRLGKYNLFLFVSFVVRFLFYSATLLRSYAYFPEKIIFNTKQQNRPADMFAYSRTIRCCYKHTIKWKTDGCRRESIVSR